MSIKRLVTQSNSVELQYTFCYNSLFMGMYNRKIIDEKLYHQITKSHNFFESFVSSLHIQWKCIIRRKLNARLSRSFYGHHYLIINRRYLPAMSNDYLRFYEK